MFLPSKNPGTPAGMDAQMNLAFHAPVTPDSEKAFAALKKDLELLTGKKDAEKSGDLRGAFYMNPTATPGSDKQISDAARASVTIELDVDSLYSNMAKAKRQLRQI